MVEGSGSAEARQPGETTEKVADQLTGKAHGGVGRLVPLGLLAGLYIGFGGMFALVARSGIPTTAYGPGQVLAGVVFALGLILVVLGGAELFTGNTMQVIAVAEERLDVLGLARSWGIVWVANLVGSLALVGLALGAGFHTTGDWAVGEVAIDVAAGKTAKSVVTVLFSGVLANMLVCLAVWMSSVGKTATDRILGVVFPIAAFVAMDLEHSVANMFMLPFGLAANDAADPGWAQSAGVGESTTAHLDVAAVAGNFAAATGGNIVGGAAIGLAYWWVHMRDR